MKIRFEGSGMIVEYYGYYSGAKYTLYATLTQCDPIYYRVDGYLRSMRGMIMDENGWHVNWNGGFEHEFKLDLCREALIEVDAYVVDNLLTKLYYKGMKYEDNI